MNVTKYLGKLYFVQLLSVVTTVIYFIVELEVLNYIEDVYISILTADEKWEAVGIIILGNVIRNSFISTRKFF